MLIYVFIGLMGIIIGSFLNVCICRIPEGEPLVNTFSRCPNCNTRLKFYDLVPIVSFIFLKGKCKYCEKKISLQYPLVEALTGVVFLLTFLNVGLNQYLIKYLFIFSLLIVVTFIDIKYHIIPNKLMLVLFIWVLGWQFIAPEISLYQAVLGSIIGGGLFFLVAIVSGGGMGGGDIKLMFSAGFLLGTTHTTLVIFLASLIGGVFGGALLAIGIKKRKDPIPFGPFLSLAIFLASLWGEEIINTYISFML